MPAALDHVRTLWPRRMFGEWAVVCLLATALAAGLLVTGASGRLDNIIYDASLRLVPRPPPPQIIIVAFDDRALAEFGAWPWSRRIHAALLDRLTAAHPKAVAYDVLFIEPSADPAADRDLARAVAASGRVCLPVLIAAPGPDGAAFQLTPPLRSLAQAAAGLGHVDLDYDPDGVSRRADLEERAGPRAIPHLMRCAQAVGNGRPPRAPLADLPQPIGDQPLLRQDSVLIPYGGGPGRFRTVSAASVVRGEIPDGFFRDRYVLSGATASGLHDSHSTPASTRNEAMAGIEVQANLLEGLITGRFISAAPVWAGLAVTLAFVWAFLASLPLLSPRRNLALGFTVIAAALALSIAGLTAFRIWLPPSPTVLTLLVVFPLWGWRRLEAASSYMVEELEGFSQEADVLTPGSLPATGGDVVARRIALLHHAIQRARDLRAYAAGAALQREQVIQLLTHDIRSPQSSILATLETAGPGAVAPEVAGKLSGYARRTLALADNFVHLAKAESGALTEEILDLGDIVTEACDDLWPLAKRAGVRLAAEGLDGERLLRGDRSLLSRAVVNLLDNAIKYSPAGGTVTARLTDADLDGRPAAQLSIADQGAGLTPEQQAGLFRRFARVAGAPAAGIGLGLTLVDEVARRHGGAIAVASEAGAGATFVLTLPLCLSSPEGNTSGEGDRLKGGGGGGTGR